MSGRAYDILYLPQPTSQPKKTYQIKVEQGEDGWLVATCPDLPGLVTQGKTDDEVEKNALEAVALMLEGTPEENKEFNLWFDYTDSE